MEPSTEKRAFPLTSRQRSIWVDLQTFGSGANYQIGFVFSIDRALDLSLLRQSLTECVRRHEALRLSVDPTQPVQHVYETVDVLLRALELPNNSDGQAAFTDWVDARMRTPFPLGEGPLFEFVIMQAASRSYFFARFHHIIIDGIGLSVFLNDLSATYDALSSGGQPPPGGSRFLDVLADEAKYLASARYANDIRYWKESLAALPECLFEQRPRQQTVTDRFPIVASTIPRERYKAFLDRCAALGIGPSSILTALSADIVCRRQGAEEAVIGVAFRGRPAGHRSAIGLYTGILPLAMRLPEDGSIYRLAQALEARASKDNLHYKAPLDEIWRGAQFAGRRRRYMSDVLMSYIPKSVADYAVELSGERLAPVPVRSPEPTPLAIYVVEIGDGMDISVEFAFNPRFVSAEEAAAMSDEFHKALAAFTDDRAAVPLPKLRIGVRREKVVVSYLF